MGVDAEGYGFPEHQRTLARLMDDIRVLSPAGVERAATGWDTHVARTGCRRCMPLRRQPCMRSSRPIVEPPGTRCAGSLFGLTESGGALISWKG